MSSLLCPECGGVLKWSCGVTDGEAYCSALQSRVAFVGSGEETRPLCNFVGRIRRISPNEVILLKGEDGNT